MDALARFQAEIFARTGVSLTPEMSAMIERGLGPGAVHVNRPLTTLAVMYRNNEYIADRVMPVVAVAKKSDSYFRFNPQTMFSIAKTEIDGNEAMPGRAAFGLDTTDSYACTSRGLIDFVSQEEVDNADDPLEPMGTSVEVTRNFLDLAREVRVAAVAFGASNYGSNTEALAGADRWDQASSDPVTKILTWLRTPLVRPDTMVIGVEAWDALRTHPKIIQYCISRASTAEGPTPLMVDAATVAKAFRLREVVIGEAKYNTAAEGQTASYSYVWGKSCALIRVEPQPNRRRTQTFGYTFRWSPGFEVRSVFMELPGLRGGTYNKVTHADAEKTVGADKVGYLGTTVVN